MPLYKSYRRMSIIQKWFEGIVVGAKMGYAVETKWGKCNQTLRSENKPLVCKIISRYMARLT